MGAIRAGDHSKGDALDPSRPPWVRVSAERRIGIPADVIARVIEDPATYPTWVEALQKFERQEDSTYVAEVGYLEYRKSRRLRRTESDPELVVWERVDGKSPERWELSAVPIEVGRTLTTFTWEKWGSGSVFGVSASSPLFKAALEVAARYSLERLEEVCRLAAKEEGRRR